MNNEVTGLLRTLNRSDILRKKIDEIQRYGFPVIILDGSEKKDDSIIDAIKDHTSLRYLHLPGKSSCERLAISLSYANSEFVVPLSDDDVFNVACIHDCIAFLKSNQDFVAAQGSFWIKVMAEGSAKFNLEEYSPSLNQVKPEDRLKRHIRYYTHTFYSVQRKSAYKQSLENALHFIDSGLFYELAQSFSMVALGKIKRFSTPYSIRSPNSPSSLEKKYTSHPEIWMRHAPDDFFYHLKYFKEKLLTVYPFNILSERNPDEFDIHDLMDQYLSDATNRSNHVLENRKYFIRLISEIYPDRDIIDILETVAKLEKRGLKEDMDIIEKGLFTLFRHLDNFGFKNCGVWSVPEHLIEAT